MGLDITSILIATYDKQGKFNKGIGMGASGPDGRIDSIEFRSALTNLLVDKLSSLSFNKKIDLINLINRYSVNKEIINDKDFQEQLKIALDYLNNKIDRAGNSWSVEEVQNKDNYWSRFKWY